MPNPCFSYPAGPPPGSRTRAVPQSGLRRMPLICFSYQAAVPHSMPYSCFTYPADAPDAGNREAGSPGLPGLRRMPVSPCFRY
jgi:hypothetical protein